MKTPLETIAKDLITVLGTKNRRKRYIQVPEHVADQARGKSQSRQHVCSDPALAKIDAALDRLELGTFGLCTQCGAEISLARLDHDPSVPNCKGCEDEHPAISR